MQRREATLGRPSTSALAIGEAVDEFLRVTKRSSRHFSEAKNNIGNGLQALGILGRLSMASVEERESFYQAVSSDLGIEGMADLRSFLAGNESHDGEPATNILEAMVYRSIANPEQLTAARAKLAKIYSPKLIAEEIAYITETHDNL
jgi:hypothetical protein